MNRLERKLNATKTPMEASEILRKEKNGTLIKTIILGAGALYSLILYAMDVGKLDALSEVTKELDPKNWNNSN